MKNIRVALVGLLVFLTCPYPLSAQSADQFGGEVTRPEPVNLDIPPQVEPDPQEIEERQLAVQAIEQPTPFHDWLLRIQPERGPREQFAAFGLLRPDDYGRAFPKTGEQIRAEAIAAHAILNPHFPNPFAGR
jgi:hypothetical protein